MTRRSLSRSAGAALAALAIFAGTAAAQAPPEPSIAVDTAFAPPSGISKFDFTTGTAADVAGGVAVYGDRIYTVGETRDSSGDADIGITARRPDGRFDTAYSDDGKETIRIAVNEGSNKGRDAGFAVVVLPDGRLRIAAAIDVDATSAINLDVAVVGVLANGGLDPSFGGGDGWLSFPIGTANDTPTRMALDPVSGRIAVTGTTINSSKDDFFVALIEPAGTLAPFGTGGIKTYNRGGVAGASVSLNDRGTDVMFKPGGGILALLQVETDPDANINGWQAVLHSFTDSGADDTSFSGDGDMVLTVGDPDTIPGGMTSYEDRIWVTGSTKTGQDTDAFLARVNADGGDLQSRRFDMRGNSVAPEQAVTSQGNDVAVVPGVPPTLVVGGFMTGDAGTDWAAAAFNDLTAGVGSFGSDDTVMATPGQGTIVGVAPGSGQWAAAGGSLLDLNSADTSFGTARLMIDADKECDLALEILRPLEISITWGQPLPLLLRVTNVGSRSCDGAISVPAPYALSRGGATGALAVGNLAAGAATTLDGVLLSYGGARLRSDTMSFTLAAPGDGNTANNVRTVRVSFGFCDLRLQSEGGATIPNEGPRRFEVEVRNGGTSPCRGLQLDVASGGRLLARGDSYTLAGRPQRVGHDRGRQSGPSEARQQAQHRAARQRARRRRSRQRHRDRATARRRRRRLEHPLGGLAAAVGQRVGRPRQAQPRRQARRARARRHPARARQVVPLAGVEVGPPLRRELVLEQALAARVGHALVAPDAVEVAAARALRGVFARDDPRGLPRGRVQPRRQEQAHVHRRLTRRVSPRAPIRSTRRHSSGRVYVDGVSLVGPPPISTQSVRARRERPARRAAGARLVPRRRRAAVRAAHAPRHHRPARAAARRLRALRPGVQPARAHDARRVHARPGRQPPDPRLARVRLQVARRRLRRPDPAARRRAADDRRRLPPRVAADDAAGVPPRADRRGAAARWSTRSSGPSRRGAPATASMSTRGRASSRCASRCGRCSASIPTAAPPGSIPRASSSARSATTGASTGCRSCAARARRGRR